MAPQIGGNAPDPFGFRELGGSWSSRIDGIMISVARATRFSPVILVPVLTIFLITVVQWHSAGGISPSRFAVHNLSSTARHHQLDSAQSDGERTTSRPVDGRRLAEAQDFSTSMDTPSSETDITNAPFEFASIHMAEANVPGNSSMRMAYARLAAAYLRPFATRANGKISRDLFMNLFENSTEECGGCFLVQVKDGKVFAYDPHAVRSSMAEFREMRMREAVHWVSSAVRRGIIRDTELVVSTTDSVASTTRKHSYRMPKPDGVPRPIFTTVRCNVSDNIPFPMVMTDTLRRGMSKRFAGRRSALLREWDSMMAGFGIPDNRSSLPWSEKVERAIFRGSIRVSAFLAKREMFDSACDRVGRSALWAIARQNEINVARRNTANNNRHRLWPLPFMFGGDRSKYEEPALDVQVDGSCGSRIYVNDHMPMVRQNDYKYSVYAEGNGFWADRLLLQLFSTTAVIKQITPCGMFFEPLLRSYEHFIPVDYWFKDVVRQVHWARQNDKEVRRIVSNARRFAGEYLSTAGVQTYVDELLTQYTLLLEDTNIQVHSKAVKLFPRSS